jgi:hypothetical protein
MNFLEKSSQKIALRFLEKSMSKRCFTLFRKKVCQKGALRFLEKSVQKLGQLRQLKGP